MIITTLKFYFFFAILLNCSLPTYIFIASAAYAKTHLVTDYRKSIQNKLFKLCTARTVWSDSIIRPVSVRSGKCTTQMVTNENESAGGLGIIRGNKVGESE